MRVILLKDHQMMKNEWKTLNYIMKIDSKKNSLKENYEERFHIYKTTIVI